MPIISSILDLTQNHIADIGKHWSFQMSFAFQMKMILQHDVHDRKRSINISSCFPGQQIPALTDLPLLTGNDYSCHARPFNEVRITGFTDWISDVQRCSTFLAAV